MITKHHATISRFFYTLEDTMQLSASRVGGWFPLVPWSPRVSCTLMARSGHTTFFTTSLDHNPTPPLHQIRKRTTRTYGHSSHGYENTWYVLYDHRLEHRGLDCCVTRGTWLNR